MSWFGTLTRQVSSGFLAAWTGFLKLHQPAALPAAAPGLSAPTNPSDLYKLYEMFRDYLKHEDDLINNRLNWNFTIQGFLFAAYTFTLQKVSELEAGLLLHVPSRNTHLLFNSSTLGLDGLRIATVAVALVGLWVSLGVYVSVSAARIAIEELERKWQVLYQEYVRVATPATFVPPLPGMTGGGSALAHRLGFWAPAALPIGFIAAWVVLIIFWWRS
jgi:hypothetical protein